MSTMRAVTNLCILSALVVASFGLPSRRDIYSAESPSGYVVGGYLKNPTSNQDYLPSMSTFVTKDVVATNTFGGLPQHSSWNRNIKEDYTEKDPVAQDIPSNPEISIEETASGESSSTTGGQNGNSNNNREGNRKDRKPFKPQEDEDDAPWWLTKGGGPSFTSFFPINIGGGGGGGLRRRPGNSAGSQDDNDTPYSPSGSATAIANSFSTGRGGVATSHATSFGDPYLASMFLRNGLYNLKGNGQRSGATY